MQCKTHSKIKLDDRTKFAMPARSVVNDLALNQLTTTIGMSCNLTGRPPAYDHFAGKLREQAANYDQAHQDNNLLKRRGTGSQEVLMHALQQVGYDDDGDNLADLADTVLSVNKICQTNEDTCLKPHLWNEMMLDDKRSWQQTP